MANKIYVNTFETANGVSVTQITPYRYRRLAGMVNLDMFIYQGKDVWYAYPKTVTKQRARRAVKHYVDDWIEHDMPSTGDLRKAVEQTDKPFPF